MNKLERQLVLSDFDEIGQRLHAALYDGEDCFDYVELENLIEKLKGLRDVFEKVATLKNGE